MAIPEQPIALMNSTEQSHPSKANGHSASQEIPHPFMEPKGSLLCLQCLTTGTYLSQINSVHNVQTYYHKIHPNIILTSTTTSYKWSLSLRFSDQNFVYSSHPCMLHDLPISSLIWLP
jgi:hypothetical protein